MKILITGGFGFLGQRLCKRILEIGELVGVNDETCAVSRVVLFDCSQPPPDLPTDSRVTFTKGDITDAGQCKNLVDEDNMLVFHLASVMSGQGEADFDLCWKVNLEGTRNLMEACRDRKGSRFIFASSGACYGERAPGPELDSMKLLPQTSYGMTKACCELMINDYARRGFLDGRVARLPTVIPRPDINSGLPAAFSAVIRESLFGRDATLVVRPDLRHAVCGFRVLVRNLLHLAQLPEAALAGSSDRCMNMPSLSVTLLDLHQAVKKVVRDPAKLGRITFQPDEALSAKLSTFHNDMDATRARSLGLVGDSSAEAIAADFAAEYVDESLLKPVVELEEEPRHWLTLSNPYLRVFRVENPPGDQTLMHRHRGNSLYFFFENTRTQGQKLSEAFLDDAVSCGEIRYGDHASCNLVHRIRTKGPRVMCCLDVEFTASDCKPEGGSEGPDAKRARTEPPAIAGLSLIKERPTARVYSLEVPAGGSWQGALPFERMLWIVHRGARVSGGLGDSFLQPADVFFREGPQQLSLEVLGGKRSLALWLVELL